MRRLNWKELTWILHCIGFKTLTIVHSLSADQKTEIAIGESKAEQRKESRTKQKREDQGEKQ